MSNITKLKAKESNPEPIFQNPEKAFTELVKLMPQLYTTDSIEVLEAIVQHASNSLEGILRHTQSLGGILAIAASDKVIGAHKDELVDTAWLISSLSNMAKSCVEIKAMAEFELAKREAAANYAHATRKQ